MREEEIEILQAAFMKLDRMVKLYHGIVHGLAIRENDIKALEVAKMTIEALQTQLKELLEIFNNGAEPESMLNADLISRQHFDERVRLAGGMADEELTQDFKDGVLTVLEMLKTEPSVQPEPKNGKWNKIIDKSSIWREAWHYECSNCGNYISGYGKYKYCPECGAKMEEGE